jgi:hypothetical protein
MLSNKLASIARKYIGKASDLYKKAMTNHKIHNVIKDIKKQVNKVAERVPLKWVKVYSGFALHFQPKIQ